jgi:hypothetical protein
LQSVYPSDHEYGRPGRFGFAPEMHLTESAPLASEQTARRLFEEWSPYWDLSRPLLLEKSPPNLIKTRLLEALYPGAAFVVIVRHPIPVSIPTAKWRGTRRYDRLLEHWLRCHALFQADRRHLERVHVLAYEQLVRDPGGVLRGIFDFLAVEPIPPSEPVDTEANEKYFQRWKELKRDPRMRAYLDLVSLRYEHRVRRYGYSIVRPSTTQMFPAWASVPRPPNQAGRSARPAPAALRTKKAAAAVLAVAALAGTAYFGSLGLATHRKPRPVSARARNCSEAATHPNVELCGTPQRPRARASAH